MKRIFFITATLLLSSIISAQTNPVDEIFEKYSEKEGFTSVYISGKMLGMLAGMEAKSGNNDNIMLRLKSIRILSEDDSLSTSDVNLYSELSRKLDLSVYEELMVVKEGQDVTKFLIRQTGDKISELLVISGGKKGNALISIRGDINLKEISQLSKTLGVEELEQLEGIDKKEPGK
jgi:hypothetical protein